MVNYSFSTEALGGVKVHAVEVSPVDKAKGVTSITSFEYPTFHIEPPLFVDETHRALMFKIKANVATMAPRLPTQLRGEVRILSHGWYSPSDGCGYRSTYEKHVAKKGNASRHFDQLCPLHVPDGHSFQHFVDGSLPKLVQAYDILRANPKVVFLVVFKDKKFPNVRRLWNRLGFKSENLALMDGKHTYSARELFLICRTPPIHPQLWQRARQLLTHHVDFHQQSQHGQKVVLISRTNKNAFNRGRMILNQKEIEEKLYAVFGEDFAVFDSKAFPTIQSTIDLFSQAKFMIGSHGGGMYNQLFAPSSVTIIEYMPTDMKTGAAPPRLAEQMVWVSARLLGQEFWRVPSPSINGNLAIDWPQLQTILATPRRNSSTYV